MYACVCTSGKARGVNVLIGAKKGIINNIGQVFRIFPLISKVLKVCDGAGTLDFRKGGAKVVVEAKLLQFYRHIDLLERCTSALS